MRDLEVDFILWAIHEKFGYDFRGYSRAHILRQIDRIAMSEDLSNNVQMLERILYEPGFIGRVLRAFSINVTAMFRDPAVYGAITEHVAPHLATYPFVKVWNAGCSTGEEAYSLAIILEERGILHKTQVYATDFNDEVLQRAADGIYNMDVVHEYSANYVAAGGTHSLSDYYSARYGAVVMNRRLKERIVFSMHNLATDTSFGTMHLIMCRNVLIYFARELQQRVVKLFVDSLSDGGFLCLGAKESLEFSGFRDCFTTVDPELKIYKKRGT